MAVKVDRELCIGAAMCTAMAPKVFDIGDEGKAVVLRPDADSESQVQDAIAACPAEAVSVGDR